MLDKEIHEKVKKILSETFKLDPKSIKRDTLLKEDLGLDSVEMTDALLMLEGTFSIKILDEDEPVTKWPKTVGDMISLIRKKW